MRPPPPFLAKKSKQSQVFSDKEILDPPFGFFTKKTSFFYASPWGGKEMIGVMLRLCTLSGVALVGTQNKKGDQKETQITKKVPKGTHCGTVGMH